MHRRRYPLDQCLLYKVTSLENLAKRLRISSAELRALASTDEHKLYKVGTTECGRITEEPLDKLKWLHKRIHTLLSRISTPDYLHSATKGRSYLTNARSHLKSQTMVKIDIKKFFRSVSRKAVLNFFINHLKCRKDVAVLLSKVLTYAGHLPTGSSSSPILSYYAHKDMFDAVASLAAKHNWVMTCYVDDITLSGSNITRNVIPALRSIIAKAGLSSHKIKFYGTDQTKSVTGVIVRNSELFLPNKQHQKISQDFAKLKTSTDTEKKLRALKSLIGRLNAAEQIEPGKWKQKATALKTERQALKKSPFR